MQAPVFTCFEIFQTGVFLFSFFCFSHFALLVYKILICVYDEQWWLGVIIEVNAENKDVLVNTNHLAGSRTSFKML